MKDRRPGPMGELLSRLMHEFQIRTSKLACLSPKIFLINFICILSRNGDALIRVTWPRRTNPALFDARGVQAPLPTALLTQIPVGQELLNFWHSLADLTVSKQIVLSISSRVNIRSSRVWSLNAIMLPASSSWKPSAKALWQVV